MHPFQRGDHVRHRAVGIKALAEVGKIVEAQRAEAVVEADAHDAVAGEGGEVVGRRGGFAHVVRAAVDVDEDRRALGLLGRPDVQIKAVLAGRRMHHQQIRHGACRELDRRVAHGLAGARLRPGLRLLRAAKALIPDRRGRKGDAEPAADAALRKALDRAVFCLCDQIHVSAPFRCVVSVDGSVHVFLYRLPRAQMTGAVARRASASENSFASSSPRKMRRPPSASACISFSPGKTWIGARKAV